MKKRLLEIVGVLMIVVSFYLFTPIVVRGNSMSPTLKEGHMAIVLKTDNVKRGDIVIVQKPNLDKNLVKRVIGEPGDVISIKDNKVFINNIELSEPYLKYSMQTEDTSIHLNDSSYFVMGDNRNNSKDSRSSEVSTIDTEEIFGKVAFSITEFKFYK